MYIQKYKQSLEKGEMDIDGHTGTNSNDIPEYFLSVKSS